MRKLTGDFWNGLFKNRVRSGKKCLKDDTLVKQHEIETRALNALMISPELEQAIDEVVMAAELAHWVAFDWGDLGFRPVGMLNCVANAIREQSKRNDSAQS